jgi:hypothetical protein
MATDLHDGILGQANQKRQCPGITDRTWIESVTLRFYSPEMIDTQIGKPRPWLSPADEKM